MSTHISRDGLRSPFDPAWFTIVEAAACELTPEQEEALAGGDEDTIEVVFTVNGVELDFEQAMGSWSKNYDRAIEERAAELVEEHLKDAFEGIDELLGDTRKMLKRNLLAKLGIEVTDED